MGGQLLNQGAPPDEHPWIERFGCTARYRAFRKRIRDFYGWYGFSAERSFNPGGGWVSNLCYDHRLIALANILGLPPHERARLVGIERRGDQLIAAEFDSDSGPFRVEADVFLDATELGDALPMAGVPYVTGFESRGETGEPWAPDVAQPLNQQAFTWVAALRWTERRRGRAFSRPDTYDFWREFQPTFWPGPFLGFTDVHPITLQPRHLPLEGARGLFRYRQVIDGQGGEFPDYEHRHSPGDAVSVVNWPMNDYLLRPVVGNPEVETAAPTAYREARELTQSLLYWLQTEAPRLNGGTGYPELEGADHFFGADAGIPSFLAPEPYIRESRRIRARFTVTGQHVATDCHPGARVAPSLPRSVGVGAYRIDLHPSTGGDNYLDISSLPFQIPLGALVPVGCDNLIAAAKNIGTTHVSNGCYRLHPVEWNIGESAGVLAALMVDTSQTAGAFVESEAAWAELEREIHADGIETLWPTEQVGPDLGPL